MESIYDIIEQITPPDENARADAKRQWDSLAKPLGSLGLLEDMAAKLAALRGNAHVRLDDRRLLVFCADNGVVRQGVTQCESSVTAKVAAALAEGRSSVSPMARYANCRAFSIRNGSASVPVPCVQGSHVPSHVETCANVMLENSIIINKIVVFFIVCSFYG